MNVVLASGSARRKQMLEAVGVHPTVAPVDVSEARIHGTVDAQVLHIAKEKAQAVGDDHAGSVVLVADTML
ncbi:MAG TPA: Maf-like protein, partial [Candidatus Poseidoniaceae archaeon]